MKTFSTNKTEELKKYLYNDVFHDAIFEKINYDIKKRIVHIDIVNHYIENIIVNIKFYGVEKFTYTYGDFCYDCNEINAVFVEDDYTYIQQYIKEYEVDITNLLYIGFEMFSLDRLHILCEKVSINIKKIYNNI